MRLLHTSDWHLGQDFYRHDRRAEHGLFLEWLLGVISEKKIDALLVAGDVFDTTNPPASAQKMFFDFLRRAHAAQPNLQIVVIAGNHDSGARLEAPAALLKEFRVTVVGKVFSNPEGIQSTEGYILPLFGKESSEPAALCLALPFLKSGDVQWPADQSSYPECVLRTYQQGIDAARKVGKENWGRELPLIALGHMHARGGSTSDDSERRLVIGGEEAVPLSQLAHSFAYVGLGHLHMPQRVGGFEHIRYSGSPLPMSFAELNYPHQVALVELQTTADASVQIDVLRVPRFVEILRCPEQPSSLDDALQALARLSCPERPVDEQPFLEVPVVLSGPTPELRVRIDEALKGKNVRLGRIVVFRKKQSAETRERPALAGLDALRQLNPADVFESLHLRRFATEASTELKRTFEEALREVNSGGID